MPDFEVNLEAGVDDIEEKKYNFIAEGDIVTIDVHMDPFVEEGTEEKVESLEEQTDCPLVHSFCYPFDIEETWWLFLIWEFEPPNRKGSVEQSF